MKTPIQLDGQWSWKGSRRIAGVLEDRGGQMALRLNGTFQGFESFAAGGRGAPSARNVIYGRTSDGRRITLVDCVVTGSAHYPGRLRHERTTYSVGWYIDGAHFRSYSQVPLPLVDYLPKMEALVRQIKQTRNYLTHFGDAKAGVLRGFPLMDISNNMRIVMQYFLLMELGFDRHKAGDIAHNSLIRDFGRPESLRTIH